LPSKEAHLKQADDNEKLATTLSKTTFTDWAVTVYFYAAVHYVEAMSAVQHVHSDDHADRNQHVNAQLKTDQVRDKYHALRVFSRQTRYDGHKPTPSELSDAEQNYLAVKNKVRALLGIKFRCNWSQHGTRTWSPP
jgi:hypothetical protein